MLGSAGSSPHARGTRISGLVFQVVSGFIPACAGNTACPALVPWRAPVHPRMRGEHARPFAGFSVRAGSSPHARGTHQIVCRCTLDKRFIPACAGNTHRCDPAASGTSVHPRMRGEHSTTNATTTVMLGSSPHARGTHTGSWLHRRNGRFIPACAGNTPHHPWAA